MFTVGTATALRQNSPTDATMLSHISNDKSSRKVLKNGNTSRRLVIKAKDIAASPEDNHYGVFPGNRLSFQIQTRKLY